jgi:hypothetical protein
VGDCSNTRNPSQPNHVYNKAQTLLHRIAHTSPSVGGPRGPNRIRLRGFTLLHNGLEATLAVHVSPADCRHATREGDHDVA